MDFNNKKESQEPISEVIHSDCFSQWLGADGLLYAVSEKGSKLTFETAKGHTKALEQLTKGKKYPLLVDLKEMHSASKEARDYLSRDQESIGKIQAVALLIQSPVSRIIGTFFLGLNKPLSLPVKMFTDKEKAQEWLKGFRDES